MPELELFIKFFNMIGYEQVKKLNKFLINDRLRISNIAITCSQKVKNLLVNDVDKQTGLK